MPEIFLTPNLATVSAINLMQEALNPWLSIINLIECVTFLVLGITVGLKVDNWLGAILSVAILAIIANHF